VTTPVPTLPPQPISPVQAAALRAGEVPPVEQVRDGVWSVSVPFEFGVPDFTLSYVLDAGDGTLAVVDPGWGADRAIETLGAGLASFGRSIDDIGLVLVTHLHSDHLGAAAAIRARSGATVAMHPAEVDAIHRWEADGLLDDADIRSWGLPPEHVDGVIAAWGSGRRAPVQDTSAFTVDLPLADGVPVAFGPLSVDVVRTPGHTDGHACFVDERSGLLFTGDHVLPRINSGLGLGGRVTTNPLEDYLHSLTLLDPYRSFEVCPGHEYRFADVAARAAVLTEHRAERTDHVARALDELDHPTLFEVASRVPFHGGIESMTGYLLASAVAQTGFHARLLGRLDEVRAV
jgi:glyoxylase-like metal-dependent hydrolase (beta-lactamase superfamily II)